MSVFIAIAVLLTLLALAWLVRPLLRPSAPAGVSSQRLNADIYRDQLQALERDLARGVISAADHETTRDELQLRLLDDTEEPVAPAQTHSPSFWSAKRTAVVLVLLLPLGSVGMYGWLGTPAALVAVAVVKNPHADQGEQMINTLAARLKADPGNLQGWAMLARSYKVMGRFAEAEQAFLKAGDLMNTVPDLMVDYADLLAVGANNNIEGRPLELVNKALALNPQHPMGLMMSGVAAYRRSDFKSAVTQWEKLLTLLEPGSPDAQQVQADISDARAKAGMPGAAASSSKLPPVDPANAGIMTQEQINLMVERLAERMKSSPDDLAGWARLARAYKAQNRLPEAEAAFLKAGKLLDTDPDLLTQFADLLAMRAGNQIEGRPLALVNKALALNPKHPIALMLAGTAAYRRADYVQAVAHWEKALSVLPPGSSDAQQVQAEIAKARTQGGLSLQGKIKP